MKTLVGFLMLWHSVCVWAHPPGLSSMDIQLQADRLLISATFAVQDIEALLPMDSDLDAEVSPAELEAVKPQIVALVVQHLVLNAATEPLTVQPVAIVFDAQNNARIDLEYVYPHTATLDLRSDFLQLMPDGHQQFVTAKGSDGQVLAEKMLTRADNHLVLSTVATPGSQTATFWGFFSLGVEHIITGYDHLLFLLGLLAVTHRVGPALKIITFFTLAHSITLAAAGLNVLELPSRVVEPLIAATIVYVGLENVLRGDQPKARHWLTFTFGLIHGFGFASILREMDISSGSSGILMPLLSFNLGIETGQIAIASVVLPLIWWLNSSPKIARVFLPLVSGIVSVMGAYWLLERTVL